MRHVLLGLLLWAVAGAAAAQAGEKLGVGDAVRVTVFQQPDLTTETRIDEKGTITMPLIGEVKVAGLTATEAGKQIAEALKKRQVPEQSRRSTWRSRRCAAARCRCSAMVARPGRYPLDETSSQLADVIAAAGGIAADRRPRPSLVMRDGKEQTRRCARQDVRPQEAATPCTSSARRCSTSTAK